MYDERIELIWYVACNNTITLNLISSLKFLVYFFISSVKLFELISI